MSMRELDETLKKDFNVATTGGLRDNKGKARLSLVPSELEEAVAEVIFRSSTEGGGKYPMNNWKKGLPFTQVAESALRHIKAFAVKGEDTDAESGLHHLAHAACNVAFLLWYLKNRPECDDRSGTSTPAPRREAPQRAAPKPGFGEVPLTKAELAWIEDAVKRHGGQGGHE